MIVGLVIAAPPLSCILALAYAKAAEPCDILIRVVPVPCVGAPCQWHRSEAFAESQPTFRDAEFRCCLADSVCPCLSQHTDIF